MHARRNPLVLTVSDGVRRLVVLAGVFLFALALTSLALQGSGPRTVEMTYPVGSQQQTDQQTDQQTEPIAAEAPSR